MASNTSIGNFIALRMATIKQARLVQEKAENEIMAVLNPPKETRQPKHWYSVEETAKKLFNWTDTDLFNLLENKGWIHRSGYNSYWLANQPQITASYLKQKAVQLNHSDESYCQLLISDIGEEKLLELMGE